MRPFRARHSQKRFAEILAALTFEPNAQGCRFRCRILGCRGPAFSHVKLFCENRDIIPLAGPECDAIKSCVDETHSVSWVSDVQNCIMGILGMNRICGLDHDIPLSGTASNEFPRS